MSDKGVQLPVVHEVGNQVGSRDAVPLIPRTYKVGELAKATGKTVRALHLYEERGLLEPVERSRGGYRLYGEDAIKRVGWIAKMQEMGYSLSDLQSIAAQWESSRSAPATMARVEATLREKLVETREQIARLQALESELEASLEYLQTCPRCSATTHLNGCRSCELHAHGEPTPDLIAGFQLTDTRTE